MSEKKIYYCPYCDKNYEPIDLPFRDAMSDHITNCSENPVSEIIADRDRTRLNLSESNRVLCAERDRNNKLIERINDLQSPSEGTG